MGLVVGLISVPTAIRLNKSPFAIIFKVKSLWWAVGYLKNARAVTIGHVVLLSPKIENGDMEHELVHVWQYGRAPLIHPVLYLVELIRKGYRNNKYEVEAYKIAKNIYKK